MKKYFLVFALFYGVLNFKAQDPVFYNSNQSLVYLNPSFAGSNGGVRNQFSYRDQYIEYGSLSTTFLNSTDLFIKKLNAGIAFTMMQDNVVRGVIKSTLFAFSYAHYFSLMDGNLKIIPSLQIAYAKKSNDSNPFGFLSPQWSEKKYADLSSGLLINYKSKFYFGASFFHLNQPKSSLSDSMKLPVSYNVHASYNLVLSKKSQLQAFCMINNQYYYTSSRLALNLISFSHLITGIALVNFDTPAISAGYRNNYFNLVIGYDYSMDPLAGSNYSSFEFHASFNLRNKEQRKTLTSFESW